MFVVVDVVVVDVVVDVVVVAVVVVFVVDDDDDDDVVLTLTRTTKSVVIGQAPVTLEWKNTPGKTQTKSGTRIYHSSSDSCIGQKI